MAIELDTISSGYSTGLINDNFQKVESWININALWRQGVEVGQANQMETDLDMNGFAILNANIDLSDPNSLITVGEADSRYINASGDSMVGGLNVRLPVEDTEPARKGQLDSAISSYQAADANLQDQLTGNTPLEASAFSEISWHGQEVENSVTIPDNKNAWSFGPVMTVGLGQAVTIGTNSFWTIANGEVQ